MAKRSSVNKFVTDIEERIDYFRQEFELNYAELIGGLDIIKHRILEEVDEEVLEDEETEEA